MEDSDGTLEALGLIAVMRFPGSVGDADCARAVRLVTAIEPRVIWHEDDLPADTTAVIVPSDDAHDGAAADITARLDEVKRFAEQGGAVLGICGGFRRLLQADMLPGALEINDSRRFVCDTVRVQVGSTGTCFTCNFDLDDEIMLPISHRSGRYVADAETVQGLRDSDRVVLRYAVCPNGSVDDIAAICNERRNVVGMMPHPERACDPLLGGTDGAPIFAALHGYLQELESKRNG